MFKLTIMFQVSPDAGNFGVPTPQPEPINIKCKSFNRLAWIIGLIQEIAQDENEAA